MSRDKSKRTNIIMSSSLWSAAKVALATTHKGKHTTFSNMVEGALISYLGLTEKDLKRYEQAAK